MQIVNGLNEFNKSDKGCVLTIGNFDGVHLGHQAIIERARRLADAESLDLVALTFYPAPVRILRPDKAPRLLTPLEMKTQLLGRLDVDQLVVVRPTADLLSQTAEQFAAEVIVQKLAARHVVEGQTFGFGKQRSGTMLTLENLGRKFNFQTHMAPARTIALDDAAPVAVTSTLIRQQVSTGRLDLAARCLGRLYTLLGRVVRGRGYGRQLGFPTANIRLSNPDQLVPEDGVFAGYVRIGGDLDQAWDAQTAYRAAVSIGRSETFDNGAWQIEAYLLDYQPEQPDLLDRYVLLSLLEKIRPQARFDSPESLAGAIADDCRRIEKRLLEKGAPSL